MSALAARLVLAGSCALLSGALFRVAASTGEGPFRMAATLLLVATGLLLASAAERWQLQEALTALEHAIAALSPAVQVLALPAGTARRFGWERGYVLSGPGGVMVMAALPISQATWGALARRTLEARGTSIRRAVHELRRQLLAGWPVREGEAGRGPALRLYGVAVLLRRRAGRFEREILERSRVGACNVEHLGDVARVVETAAKLPPNGAERDSAPAVGSVAEAATRLWGARPLARQSPAAARAPLEAEG